MIAFAAIKVLTEKRLELFREAGSGYNLTAFYLAVNITSTIEHTIQIIFVGVPVIWQFCSASGYTTSVLNFILMAWVSTSWALFFPIFIGPEYVQLVIAAFFAVFNVLFCGFLDPGKFSEIYGEIIIKFLSGMFSTTRYFVETWAVAERRTLPPQSGWTLQHDTDLADGGVNWFNIAHLAQDYMPETSHQSFAGWNYQLLSPFCVGITIRLGGCLLLHISNRSEQARSSILTDMRSSVSYCVEIITLVCLWLLSFVFTLWQIRIF